MTDDSAPGRGTSVRWALYALPVALALNLLVRVLAAPALGRATATNLGLGVALGVVLAALDFAGDWRRWRRALLYGVGVVLVTMPAGWLIDRVWR